jgi:RimJ/RimL family protein N-acetyltransferase
VKYIDCTPLYLPLLCRVLDYMPTPWVQCITCVEDGKAIAGVVYDGFNTTSIGAHIWIDEGAKPHKEWIAAIFDYPFNRLGVKKIVGQVNSRNEEAQKLDEHFGFILEARVTDYFEEGDLLLYTMTKEQCRILNSPRWAPVVDIIRRVA